MGANLKTAVLLGGLLGFAALFWVSVIQPAAAWKAAQFTARDQNIESIRVLQDRIDRLRIERRDLQQDGDDGIIWPARQMGEATARVQSEINAIAAQNRVMLQSITPTDSNRLPSTRSASFRVEAEARLDAFRDFLIAVEFHAPALLIEQATIRRLTRVEDSGAQPLIFAQIELTAPVSLLADREDAE